MAREERKLYRGFVLRDWRVWPLTGQLESPDGTEVHVTPKAMEVLVCLASNSGELVERSTIFEKVWGKPPWSDEALTHCVSELRQAFGDKADDPQFIQTVPKRGYRLIPRVGAAQEVSPPSAAPDDDDPLPSWVSRQLGDLRKRKVFQTVIAYPVLAWLLVQIVDVIWEYLLAPLGAPAWLVPTFVVLLALGYPVAVFLSWAVDLTPEGVQLTRTESSSTPLVGGTLLGLGALAVTVGALVVYFNAYEPPKPMPPAPDTKAPLRPVVPKSIAVLRFINIGGDPAVAYLSDGLTEELIHELTNLNKLKVAARTSVWPLSTTDLSVAEIIDRLSVERVLEGSVRSDGEQIRVTAQLIDSTGFHVWSETYDRELENLLEVQKEIAAQVVDELELVLTDEGQARLKSRPTYSSAAYDQYLRGRVYLREPATADSIAAALGHFEAAIEADSRFPLAYAGLCESHLAAFRLTRATESFEQAEVACHRAMTLDGGLAEVYTALGNLYRHSGQPEKAEQEYQVALKINPTLEEATFGLGRVYQAMGRLDDAEAMLRRSVELEPGFWGSYLGIGNFLHRQGRYEEAIPFYEEVTRLRPDYAGGYTNLGSAYHWLGDWEKAEAAWTKSIELEPTSVGYQNMGVLYYYQHRFEEAAEFQRKALEIGTSDHRTWGRLAAALRYVDGEEQASQEAYGKALEIVTERLTINPDEVEDLAWLSGYQVNTGELGQARETIARAVFLEPQDAEARYFSAIVNLHGGNPEEAIEQLEKAVEFGYSLKLIESDPQFSDIRDFAGFEALTSGSAAAGST